MLEPSYDVLVIGAGPAGLTAGRQAAQRGLSVAILERMPRPASKLLLTGKGRCNLCNDTDTASFIAQMCRGGRFLYSSASRFGPAEVMDFFRLSGLALVTERGGRVFPQSGRSQDVADVLVTTAQQAGCLFLQDRATEILCREGGVSGVRTRDAGIVSCRSVILATGGLSYPATGSTGDGYRMARQLGHTVRPTYPSLVPLVCQGDICPRLEGLSLRNVTLTLRRGESIVCSLFGEMLFTADGLSGPVVLTASTQIQGDCSGLEASIDLKPALDVPTLDRRLLRDLGESPQREFRNCLSALLPRTLIPIVIEMSGIDPYKRAHSVTAVERRTLLELLKGLPLTVTGTRPIAEAVVTGGGIALEEVDPRTMQSKIVRGLFFAGEMLDADGPTGGFNLGIAFATGYAAGSWVLDPLGEKKRRDRE